MNSLLNMANNIPSVFLAIIIITTIMSIIARKYRKIIIIGISIIIIYCFIIIPNIFLSAFFEDFTGIALVSIVILVVWLFISLMLKFKNRLIIQKNNEKEIYIRDINVKYSPAVLSYLINNKIETSKDLSATLLNLCANNVLKIEKDVNGQLNIIDLKNESEVEKLSEDEKYAYKMLKTEVTIGKISTWKRKVKEEYEKYRFSKPHKKELKEYFMLIYGVLFIIAIFLIMINEQVAKFSFILLLIVFLSLWEVAVFSTLKGIIGAILDKDFKSEFIDTYTRKGAIEYNRWKKFEKFIEDYTLLKDREFDSIIVLGKYLSYSIALGINTKCDKELYEEIDKNYCFDFNTFSSLFEMKEKE